VQVRYGIYMVSEKFFVKSIEPEYTFMPFFYISFEHLYILELVEHGNKERPGKNSNLQLGILPGQRGEHRYRHGNIAHGGETDDQKSMSLNALSRNYFGVIIIIFHEFRVSKIPLIL